ncbi:hypothetical protein EST38_g10008 [Candolleomyces aberdarensis]|uniref:Glycosyl hydrolase family 92 domain-containing protein n=1 Tax=Candolleomyces aberdarensis TaxID=2316362 RepID=A0A4Q2D8I3_9AGAR|nr:hypothetical protein EST38_g10008 [Candolleomyces aberdarensis]
MGSYPVNPVSGEHVVEAPFFDSSQTTQSSSSLSPTSTRKTISLKIKAAGARTKLYVKLLMINGAQLANNMKMSSC